MTDMRRLRNRLRPFLAKGVRIHSTKLEAGESLTLELPGTVSAHFNAVGDDHTFLQVTVDSEDVT